jgi:hypothetical protein
VKQRKDHRGAQKTYRLTKKGKFKRADLEKGRRRRRKEEKAFEYQAGEKDPIPEKGDGSDAENDGMTGKHRLKNEDAMNFVDDESSSPQKNGVNLSKADAQTLGYGVPEKIEWRRCHFCGRCGVVVAEFPTQGYKTRWSA